VRARPASITAPVKASQEGIVLEKLPVELGDVLKQSTEPALKARHTAVCWPHVQSLECKSSVPHSPPGSQFRRAIPPMGPVSLHRSSGQRRQKKHDSLVLMVEDADSPTPHPLVHAIAINLDPARGSLLESALNVDEDEHLTRIDLGVNSLLMRGWLPPDPPPGHGEHRYVFQVFALASGAALPNAAGRHQVFEAISARALAAGCLLGTYERPRRIEIDDAARDGLSGLAEAADAPAAT
jgi:phosphatidylethanolamine-binding protein (PEBP) family uncharacterized protein